MAEKGTDGNRLIWVDCEMTGLDDNTDQLLEIACLITEGDEKLTLVAEGPNLIIHQSDSVLQAMGEWCTRQHGESGLIKAVQQSKITIQDAERQLLDFVRKHTPVGICPMAGNSVYADKIFLKKYLPKFVQHFHYRLVDVSTVKELCRRWYPEKFAKAPPKQLTHRALDDIKESVSELRYYKTAIFSANTDS